MDMIGFITENENYGFPREFVEKYDHNRTYTVKGSKIKIYWKGKSQIVVETDKYVLYADDNLFEATDSMHITSDKLPDNLDKNNFIDWISNINSNFRMVFIDTSKTTTYLVSNRAAAGRIHYTLERGKIIFSNNYASLASLKACSINNVALYAYIKLGAIPEDITLFDEIRSVPVGHCGMVDLVNENVKYMPYYKFDFVKIFHDDNIKKYLDDVDTCFKKFAKSFSDKTVHLLISGGVDSALLGFYLKQYAKNVKIFGHYGQFGDDDPELVYAQQVSDKLGVKLNVHMLKENNVINAIEDTALNTTYPHSDYSNVPTNFLIKGIKNNFPDGLIIEGTGGDGSFGFTHLSLLDTWSWLLSIPKCITDIVAYLSTIDHLWYYDSRCSRALFSLYRAKEENLLLAYVVTTPCDKFMLNVSKNSKKYLCNLMTKYSLNNINGKPSDYAKMVVSDILHVNSRLQTAKSLTVADSLDISICYPFLWKDSLDVQAQIPLNVKIHDGIIKWPLKKILEDFMPHDFVHRMKSGFAPPLVEWVQNDDIYEYVRKKVLNGYMIKYFKHNIIEEIIEKTHLGKRMSRFALNSFWSILFLEIWLEQHKLLMR